MSGRFDESRAAAYIMNIMAEDRKRGGTRDSDADREMSNDREAGESSRLGAVYRFHAGDYPQELHIAEGTPFVQVSTVERIREALEAGYAVYGEGCDGKVFLWPTEEGYEADHFFLGPAALHRFDDPDEAAEFAAGLCE